MRSFLLLAVAAALACVLLAATTVSAQSAFTSCNIASVTIKRSTGETLYSRNSFDPVPVYTVSLGQYVTPTVSVDVVMTNPALATGSLAYILNGTTQTTVQLKPLNGAAPGAQQLTGLSTQCQVVNTISVRSRMSYEDDFFAETCNYLYMFRLANPGCVHGDPQFAGLRGQSYQVHGIDGAVYALISAPEFLLNSRFQFLEGPRPCPVMPTTGRKSVACWSHPGSYLGSVGLLTTTGQAIEMQSGAADAGFAAVRLNGRELAVGDSVPLVSSNGVLGSVTRNSTHEVTLTVGVFVIELENNDFFINLRAVRVAPQDWKVLAAQHVHGLLGQTWQARRYAGAVKEIEGEVDDYVVAEDSLHGYQFVYNRFNGVATA